MATCVQANAARGEVYSRALNIKACGGGCGGTTLEMIRLLFRTQAP
jgi:hypothetical protein